MAIALSVMVDQPVLMMCKSSYRNNANFWWIFT